MPAIVLPSPVCFLNGGEELCPIARFLRDESAFFPSAAGRLGLDMLPAFLLVSAATAVSDGVKVVLRTHDPPSHQIAHFGPFLLDFRSSELFKDGTRVRVQEHSVQILMILLEKPGEVVTREELRQRLWHSQTFVDFDQGLNTAMMRLRHALEDTVDMPKFIETLPRHGYRFTASVTFSRGMSESQMEDPGVGEEASEMTHGLLTENQPATGKLKGTDGRWRRTGMIAAGVVVVLLLAIGFNWGRLSALLLHARPSVQVPTLAILPFDSLSNDPAQDYLAESMTEQLITELGQNQGLRVVSRGSVMQFSGIHVPLEAVAKNLHADDIFEGSISESRGRLRVTANLYQLATQKHLWAETYEIETGEGFSPQREIARDIAQKIRAKLSLQ
jgi:TolB-like protein/DNA-binding winged helix-turn-helix (wHTH) protein